MTTVETNNLSDRQLDALVAERVMGWVRGHRWGNGNGEWIIDGELYEKHRISWDRTPRYSTGIAAAMQVEDRIAGLGELAKAKYVNALRELLGRPSLFDIAHADPRQRCLAALAALEGTEGK